jgi:6-phosphogluconolactonase
VNCELGGIVVACDIDDSTGLTPKQSVRVYPEEFVGAGHPDNFGKADFWTAEAVLSHDDRYLITICRIDHSLSVLPVLPDGSLDASNQQRVQLLPGSNARNLTLTPSGGNLLVASQDADAVEVFRLELGDGSGALLTRVDTQPVNCAADVAVV